MLRCNIQSTPSLHCSALCFRQQPVKSVTFRDHFKGKPDLCMQTQMKTDQLVDEKGKDTPAWSTRFCDMLITRWPCLFPYSIPSTFFVNHSIDRLIWKRGTVLQPQVTGCRKYIDTYNMQQLSICLVFVSVYNSISHHAERDFTYLKPSACGIWVKWIFLCVSVTSE